MSDGDNEYFRSVCPASERVDGPYHSWEFWGDDPYIICWWCKEMRDALTGDVKRKAAVSDGGSET